MAIILTKQHWIEILQNKSITRDLDLSILQGIYAFENHQAAASQIGALLGYKSKNLSSPLNLEIGRYGKRIASNYPIQFSVRADGSERKWDIFFNGWQENNLFIWQLKESLCQAMAEIDLTGTEQFPEELPESNHSQIFEGVKKTVTVNTYERNPRARSICVNHWQPICQVCNINFFKAYGEIGKNFIHIHHLIPVSQIGNSYEIDPIKDLIPVCPNCHAMLHKKNPPFTINELREILYTNSSHNHQIN
jgi:5-methylcytosine-specific restriction protein A